MNHRLRNVAAAALRSFPPLRGKGSIGAAIDKALGRPRGSAAICSVRMRDGSVLRLDTRNSAEMWAYWTGYYDTGVRGRLLAACPPGATVLDIGANVGLWSVPLGTCMQRAQGRVWAFEPVPANYAILCDQIRRNNLADTVFPVRVALGERSGNITLAIMESDTESLSGNAMIVTDDQVGRTCTAPLIRLDDWAAENQVERCGLIKIDVEGAELSVLRGGLSFISKHRPLIFGEFSPYWMSQAGLSFRDVTDLMLPMDYHVYERVGEMKFARVREPQAGVVDVLLLPSETGADALSVLGAIDVPTR
jgi:FkbM family methyltransferase